MLRKLLLGLALGWTTSCAYAQTAPSPADVGISKGNPDVFKLKGHDDVWTPFGSVDPTTHVFTPAGGGGGGSIVGGTTPVTGACPNGQFIYNNSAVVGCASVAGGGAAPFTLYPTHALLMAGITTPSGGASTVAQQGFYNPGDGGDATYQWNSTSLCPGGYAGTPTVPADGLSCILPSGQSAATPGRYLLSFPSGSINARTFGLQPGIGTAFDNSPLLPAIFAAIGPPAFGPNGPDIIFPPTLGQVWTNYYFSQPFEITHGSSIRCSNSSKISSGLGSKVEFNFPAGVPGVAQENSRLSMSGGGDTGSTIEGCSIGSFGSRWITGSGAIPGATSITGLAPSEPQTWVGAAQPLLAAGDGVVALGLHAINGGPLVQPGAYIQSVSGSAGSQTITLASPYVVGPQSPIFGGQHANVWRLPASEKYQVTTTAGSANAVITGGNRPLKLGAWVWSEAFVFGSVVMKMNNQVASATVNTGGSGYVGTSGTMTGNAAPGCSVAPVLNVTASGGAITAVTSVSAGGTCNNGNTPNTWALWTPGGGLSGGSGATFNMTWANSVTMSTMAASAYQSPALPGKTGTYNLWTLPAGVTRRIGASTQGDLVELFPIGLELYCDAGGGLSTGCANSKDEGDAINGGMIGRYVTGSDCAPSTAIGNVYGQNLISDIVESCSLGNQYINENTNSPENDVGKYSVLGFCDSLNVSIFIGGYISGGTSQDEADGFCLGPDVNGNVNIGVPVKPFSVAAQSSFLAIGSSIPGTATVGARGDMFGSFRWEGAGAETELAASPTAIGGATISLASAFGMLDTNYTVSDLTHPTAIPANTTVTSVTGAPSVTISNPVASPGISTNDQISFAAPFQPCINMIGGVDLIFKMAVTCDQSGTPADDFVTTWNPGVGAWTINNLWLPTPNAYHGYRIGADLVAPSSIAIGSDGSYSLGHERTIDIDPAPFTNNNHLEGDVRFNRKPVPGGNWGWAYAASFTTTLSENVLSGTASFTASIATTNMSVTAISSGSLCVGGLLANQPFNTPPAPNTTIVSLPGGAVHGCSSATGTYVVTPSQTLAANGLTSTGQTVVAAGSCPSPSLPAGTPIDYGTFDDRFHMGDLATCVGTTLTFQAAALVNGASGQQLLFMQPRPAAPIANDVNGASWTLGNYLTLNPVALASLPATCAAGTFAVINNGVAAPVYNAAVGSTTGAATDPVFCTNGNVWKYH